MGLQETKGASLRESVALREISFTNSQRQFVSREMYLNLNDFITSHSRNHV